MNERVPEGWKIKSFGDFLISLPKSTLPSGVADKLGYYDFYVCSKKVLKYFHREMSSPAVLFSTGGEASVHFAAGNYSYSTDVWATEFTGEICNEYAFRVLEKNLKQINYAGFQGSGIKHLDKGFIQRFTFSLPSLPEQKKIASILTSVDEVIENTQKQINKLQDLKKATMNELLTNGIGHTEFKDSELGRIPKSWNIIKLSDIRDITDKYSFTGGPFGSNLKRENYTEKGIRIIQLQNIGDGQFFNKYKIYTSGEKADELLSCNIYPGDIILSKMGDPVARATLIPDFNARYLMASDGIRLSVDDEKYDSKFILDSINHHTFRNQAEISSTGSTRKRIGLVELRRLKISTSSLIEQKKIASIFISFDEAIDKKQKNNNKLKSLKKSLMQDLLTGKVRVTVN
ncbi:restriction endonuclease subunit S [Candidatus Persebacteraceae bacterium Df01]|jgi:type I restriction enzyme S subunit|uniref:Restriction endonuclease subunit S n=1 Tax=Candidatus Doriopsillibacter californiensis TaxID=2970740 RepID=A0ABT7QND8_9GAMM|nr:restriction endonuclease subunit S [Candidatus Persebacteraceae bacterium Df01]